jgi:hypothetical protein
MTNPDNKELDPCLPDEYLRAYALEKVSDVRLRALIEAHVELCPKCTTKAKHFRKIAIPADHVSERELDSLRKKQAVLKQQYSRGLRPGTIWRTVPEKEGDFFGPLVFIVRPLNQTVPVAEVSEDIQRAIETDMILDPRETGLRFRCMVRAGNIFEIAPKNLRQFAGELPASVTEKVLKFFHTINNDDLTFPLSKVTFLKDLHGNEFMYRGGITSGIVVTSDSDLRIIAAEESKQRYRYLRVPRNEETKSFNQIQNKKIELREIVVLLKEMISELSMWGHLNVSDPKPSYSRASAGELADLGRQASIRRSSQTQTVQSAKETVTSGPTREAVQWFHSEKLVFHYRDFVTMSLTAPETGYIVVVHYSESSGDVQIVFPKPDDKTNQVLSKHQIYIKRKLKSPPGQYAFKALFCRRQIHAMSQILGSDSGREKHLNELIRQIKHEEDWRELTLEYEVLKKKRFFSGWFS